MARKKGTLLFEERKSTFTEKIKVEYCEEDINFDNSQLDRTDSEMICPTPRH
jgi:hypothetical protein